MVLVVWKYKVCYNIFQQWKFWYATSANFKRSFLLNNRDLEGETSGILKRTSSLSESYMVYGYWSWSWSSKLKLKIPHIAVPSGRTLAVPWDRYIHGTLTSTYNLNFNSNTHKPYMHLKALKELYKMLSGTLLWTPLPSGANKVFLFFSCSGNVNFNVS